MNQSFYLQECHQCPFQPFQFGALVFHLRNLPLPSVFKETTVSPDSFFGLYLLTLRFLTHHECTFVCGVNCQYTLIFPYG